VETGSHGGRQLGDARFRLIHLIGFAPDTMPTIPLYTPSAGYGEAHNVIAPGGYEYWSADVRDKAQGLRLIIVQMEGSIFDDRYLESYARYRKHPTRNAPPSPRDYPGISVTLTRNGDTRTMPLDCDFSRLIENRDGRIEIVMNYKGIIANLRLTPKDSPPSPQYSRVYPDLTGEHFAAARIASLDAAGEVQLPGELIQIAGIAIYNRGFGTSPATDELRKLLISGTAGSPLGR
jgi:hypothetical protein